MKIKYIIYSLLIIIIILVVLHDNLLVGNFHKTMYPEYYESPFFKIKGIDKKNMMLGKDIASSKKIVLCGVCRDIDKIVSKNIKFFQIIGEQFKDYRIVLFENDSKDNTRNVIKEHCKINSKIKLLECVKPFAKDCKFGDKKMYDYGPLSNKRMDRMAHFRNQYLNYIKKNLSDYDYVLMMDMDVDGYFNIDGLMEVIGKENWDIVFCNGRSSCPGTFGFLDGMYDGLAYLNKKDSYTRKRSIVSILKAMFEMQLLNEKYIHVKSAFNGCGIYKMNVIKNIEFKPGYSCEWLSLHHGAYKNGYSKIFISRDWKLYVGIQGVENRLKNFIN